MELLNEVSHSNVTGEEELYSRTDLHDFSANVAGARAAFEALEPTLRLRDTPLADQIGARFKEMKSALDPYRAGSGFVAYTQLTQDNTRALSQAADALAEPLSRIAERLLAQPAGA